MHAYLIGNTAEAAPINESLGQFFFNERKCHYERYCRTISYKIKQFFKFEFILLLQNVLPTK